MKTEAEMDVLAMESFPDLKKIMDVKKIMDSPGNGGDESNEDNEPQE